jgi:hypothetical protein
MNGRLRNVALTAVVIAAFVAAAAGVYYWKYGRVVNSESLMGSLPGKDGAVVFLDVRTLRALGVLDSVGGAAVTEEADYKAFVAVTHFNYREDLDAVVASYRNGDVYALAAGRFDWTSLRNYALTQSGKCTGDVCSMPSSQPGRTITFFPFRSGVMAFAVGQDPNAASAFRGSQPPFAGKVSSQPFYVSIPGALFKGDERLPAGTKLFSKILETTQRVNFAFGPKGAGFELSMDAAYGSEKDAEGALNQFDGVTEIMRKYFARVNQTPSPEDLSGVLTSGIFRREGARVHGGWPIERKFLENFKGGGR